MPLDKIPPMPSARPTVVATYDAAMSFNGPDVVDTINAPGMYDLSYQGKPTVLDIGTGRLIGTWIFQTIQRRTDADQFYRFILLGCIDGDDPMDPDNFDILQMMQFGGTNRPGPAGVVGVSVPVPGPLGLGLRNQYPFINQRSDTTYRYLRCRVQAQGSNLDLKFQTWITYEVG